MAVDEGLLAEQSQLALSPSSSNISEGDDHNISYEISTGNADSEDIFSIFGRRNFDVAFLVQQLSTLSCHQPFDCGFQHLKFFKESRRGYRSEFEFKCDMCNQNFTLLNVPKDDKLNEDVVHGTICTGQSYEQLNEHNAIINIPSISKDTFYKVQQHIERALQNVVVESMKAAAEEEATIARAENNVDKDGYPLITVVADGAWAKRSYRTNYNSLSGVACIVGYRTKKVLYIGIRNSYCCICAKHCQTGGTVKEHICYKNWSASAPAMESDIIAEGFKLSVEMYGLKYHRLIGDSDSSVMDKISKNMPYGPNLLVQKINCSNHICRNYRNRLRDLTKKKCNDFGVIPINLRKIVQENVERLAIAVQSAIKYRSQQKDKTESERIAGLVSDLKNGPNHVFGLHSKCADYFCDRSSENNLVPDLQLCGLWDDIMSALNLLIHQSTSLIYNVNNNMAECFNSVVAKFVGGKRVNFTQRGSYQARCNAAVTAYNTGKQLHRSLRKKLTGVSPGKYTKKYAESKSIERGKLKARRLTYRRNRKSNTLSQQASTSDMYYGIEQEPDMDTHTFNEKKDEFLKSLQMTSEERKHIQQNTKGQSLSHAWKTERLKRLTASNFGKVCKMRPNTSCANFVKNSLYSTFGGL